MSGNPTPRFGRALRLFMPLVVIALFVVPFVSSAKDHEKGPKGATNVVADTPAHTNAPAGDNVTYSAPDKSAGDDQGQGDDKSKGDDRGKDNAPGQNKDQPKGDDQGHGNAYGHDKGADHGKGKAKGHDKDRSPSGSAPAGVPSSAPSLTPTAPSSTKVVHSCTSRRSVTIRLDRRYRVRAATVMVNGKVIRVRYGRHVTATISLRGRAAGTYTVRTAVLTKGGRVRTSTRRFKTCAAKRIPARKPR